MAPFNWPTNSNIHAPQPRQQQQQSSPSSSSDIGAEFNAIRATVSSSVSRWMSQLLDDDIDDPSMNASSPSSSSANNSSNNNRHSSSGFGLFGASTPTTNSVPRPPTMAPCPPGLYEMFAMLDPEVVEAVYVEHDGNAEAATMMLLAMSDPDFARNRTPSPPPQQQRPAVLTTAAERERQRRQAASHEFLAASGPAFLMRGSGTAEFSASTTTHQSSVPGFMEQASHAGTGSTLDPLEDVEEVDLIEKFDEIANKTKLLLQDVASKFERFTTRVADEFDLGLGSTGFELGDVTPAASSRASLTLSLEDEDASILYDASAALSSMMPPPPPPMMRLDSGSRYSSRRSSLEDAPLTSPLPGPANMLSQKRGGGHLSISTQFGAPLTGGASPSRGHSRSSSVSSLAREAPLSPFVISEPGDSDDEADEEYKKEIFGGSATMAAAAASSPPRSSSLDVPSPAASLLARRVASFTEPRPRSPLAVSPPLNVPFAAAALSSSHVIGLSTSPMDDESVAYAHAHAEAL
ncbi:hypothetical protein BC828DRAFT_378798 [Blastocladiella britannica]|nr:hypothetical protein BC828DRAFT_378798 [Blastocladiella britannica]